MTVDVVTAIGSDGFFVNVMTNFVVLLTVRCYDAFPTGQAYSRIERTNQIKFSNNAIYSM
jgi:hypothetical protein